MAIYANEHMVDLLNEQYEKVRDLEKDLKDTIELLKFIESRSCPSGINHKVWDLLSRLENKKVIV